MDIRYILLCATCLLPAVFAGESIVLVKGDLTAKANPPEAQSVGTFFQTVADCLKKLGLPYRSIGDADVETGALQGARLAIFPYNSQISDAEAEQIEAFAQHGGKLIAFYTPNPRLLKLLGLRFVSHQAARPGEFSQIAFGERLPGSPAAIIQSSWNIFVVEPAAETASTIGRWQDRDGKQGPYPAILWSPAGAYISHVLTQGDTANKARFLAALIVSLDQTIADDICSRMLAQVGVVGGHKSLPELQAATVAPEARPFLAQVGQHTQAAQKLMLDKNWGRALAEITAASEDAASAFYASQTTRPNEFRAIWIHTAFGLGDAGWDRSLKTLADSHFSAVIPNMLWAGLAFYPSKVLPVDPAVAERGDQIAQCLAAARKHGLQVHVWKVNYNLSNAPKDFVDKLRRADRIQKQADGRDVDWLCPSHPDNVKLELDSIIEVIRDYDIDGFHFDYIRYPDERACYCTGCRERFQKDTRHKPANWPGDVLKGKLREPFLEWRREQVTRLVRLVRKQARSIKPALAISAAVFPDWRWSPDGVGQDAKLWINEGLLDFVCPMDYTTRIDELRRWVTDQTQAVGGRIPVLPGIGAFQLADPADVCAQIQLARELGANGFVVFQFDDATAATVLPALKVGVTKAPPARTWNPR